MRIFVLRVKRQVADLSAAEGKARRIQFRHRFGQRTVIGANAEASDHHQDSILTHE